MRLTFYFHWLMFYFQNTHGTFHMYRLFQNSHNRKSKILKFVSYLHVWEKKMSKLLKKSIVQSKMKRWVVPTLLGDGSISKSHHADAPAVFTSLAPHKKVGIYEDPIQARNHRPLIMRCRAIDHPTFESRFDSTIES